MHPTEISAIHLDAWRYHDAEKQYQMKLAGTGTGVPAVAAAAPDGKKEASPAAPAKQGKAKESVASSKPAAAAASNGDAACQTAAVEQRMARLELENQELKKTTADLRVLVAAMEARLSLLEAGKPSAAAAVAAPAPAAPAPAKQEPAAAAKPAPADDDDDDSDEDLFGDSDEEDSEEKQRQKEERLAAYHEKKAKKPALIAKSSILLDVKPWDDETDMEEMEALVRGVECDGLVWGAAKLVPLAYGIKKLQICCVVEDDKVSTDWLEEQITGHEDHVQSVDIAAFNKI